MYIWDFNGRITRQSIDVGNGLTAINTLLTGIFFLFHYLTVLTLFITVWVLHKWQGRSEVKVKLTNFLFSQHPKQ